jgi:endogenous inhibitor of DNA gyrase (YacG/DUF329 family)
MSAPTVETVRECLVCWIAFIPAQPRHHYCSTRCRKVAYGRRKRSSTGRPADTQPIAAPAPASTDRACPHCGEPVVIVSLLTTHQAAHPTMPTLTTWPRRE